MKVFLRTSIVKNVVSVTMYEAPDRDLKAQNAN
jgi:hypothetical protein